MTCELKTCTKCNVAKPLSQFSKNPRARDGLRYGCKQCAYESQKKWVAKNIDHVKGVRVRYYAENKDKSAQARREWVKENPDRLKFLRKRAYWRDPEKARAARAAWREANPELAAASVRAWLESPENRERARELHAAWKRANAGRVRESSNKRRAKKRSVPWSDPAAILRVYESALLASKLIGRKYSVDHVYPLQGKTVSGLHVAANLQVIPLEKNAAKRDKLPGSLSHELWDPSGQDVYHG